MRTCDFCGETFEPRRKNQRFCGKPKECRVRYHNSKKKEMLEFAKGTMGSEPPVPEVVEEHHIPLESSTDLEPIWSDDGPILEGLEETADDFDLDGPEMVIVE